MTPTVFQRHTLAQAAERYLTERTPFLSATTASEYRRCLRSTIVPAFEADRRVATITRDEILAWHVSLGLHPFAANRALNLLAHVLSLCIAWGWRNGPNPCTHLQRFPEPPRKRRFADVELESMGEALHDLRFEQAITPESDDAIRALLLTGARKTEILALAWKPGVPGASGWCDLQTGVLHLTNHKTKRCAGDKDIELAPESLEVFRRRWERRNSSPWVFPGRRGNHLKGLQKAWKRTRTAAHVSDGHINDARATFASTLLECGVPLPDVGDQLGHSDLKTTRKHYAWAVPNHKRAVAAIAAHVIAHRLGGR
jgi:integrase